MIHSSSAVVRTSPTHTKAVQKMLELDGAYRLVTLEYDGETFWLNVRFRCIDISGKLIQVKQTAKITPHEA
jgi:hypothetical protein